jgi:hypothetical protein
MDIDKKLANKLAGKVLLSQRSDGDTLVLVDEVLLAALEGRRALTAEEAVSLKASPLTLRRFRLLADQRRRPAMAANDPVWHGSDGLLRAASSGSMSGPLHTDDGYWTLHVAGQPGEWRLILALAPDAPFAASLLRAAGGIRVLDGQGNLLLEGVLDADGECEAAWAHAAAPFQHLQQTGASFSVRPN